MFLSIWLCGWAVGETFAVYALTKGTPRLNEGRLAITAFLLLWVSIWTLGGLFAMEELHIHRRLGPFRRTTAIARTNLKRITTLRRRPRLVAQTSSRAVEITALADRMECEALARDLNEALGLFRGAGG